MRSNSNSADSLAVEQFSPPLDARQPRRLPAWVLSTTLHVVVFVALGFWFRFAPQGAAVEPGRSGGIVLVQNTQGKAEYFTEGDAGDEAKNTSTQSSTANAASALAAANELPAELDGALPKTSDAGLGSSLDEGQPNAGALTAGVGPGKKIGGQVQTGVFGVQGTGSKFLYVFDRSGSMEGYQGRPMRAAKQQLIASLEHLDPIHQFQIIFYNERPHVFNPFGKQNPTMMFGDDQDKRLAANYIRGIVPSGATRHMEPLKMAVKLKPDVIFFLTDAEEPQLSDSELRKIQQLNRFAGASINTIEFGTTAPQGGDNFLKKLARQNGGQYVYINVTTLPLR